MRGEETNRETEAGTEVETERHTDKVREREADRQSYEAADKQTVVETWCKATLKLPPHTHTRTQRGKVSVVTSSREEVRRGEGCCHLTRYSWQLPATAACHMLHANRVKMCPQELLPPALQGFYYALWLYVFVAAFVNNL